MNSTHTQGREKKQEKKEKIRKKSQIWKFQKMPKYGYSVFVGNLSRRARRDDLYDLFRDIGRVIEVDIKTGFGK